MYFIEDHYYTINKSVLRALGIWPYDQSHTVIFQRVLIILILGSHIFVQLSVFITKEYSMALFLRFAIFAFFFNAMIVQYCFFIINSKTITNIHYQIRYDWNLLRDKAEYEIMEQNAQFGQICIRLLFSLIGFICISVVVIQFLPDILDIVWPLDEPRPRYLLIMVEYFIPHNKYFYIKVLHELLSVQLGWIIGGATFSQILGFICHSFGMFKLARYRIRHSIENCVWFISSPEKDRAICNAIMHATIAHRRAKKFATDVIASVNTLFCIVTIIAIAGLVTDLYGIIEVLTISQDMKIFLECCFFGGGVLLFIFLSHYLGRKLTDCSGDLAMYAYDTSWYLMPLSSQKLILFLIQNTGKEFTLAIGYILEGKIENFVMIVKAAMSYVTVLYNMYNK